MMITKYFSGTIVALTVLLIASVAHALPEGSGYESFSSTGSWQVPAGVSEVRVLAIGGGGAGAGSHYRGGGSGYIESGILAVTPGQTISIIVGAAGQSAGCAGNSCSGGNGGTSSFGDLITANGGIGGSYNQGSGNGGSGGGGAGNAGFGGNGGTGGANGDTGDDYPGGIGQGQDVWSSFLDEIAYTQLSAGPGGAPSNGSHQGGGGGGGILIFGSGPSGENGGTNGSLVGAEGGSGYGAGGGSGGYNSANGYAVGGNGAAGLVYIEWGPDIRAKATAPVPSTSTYGLVLLALALLLMAARFQRSSFRKD